MISACRLKESVINNLITYNNNDKSSFKQLFQAMKMKRYRLLNNFYKVIIVVFNVIRFLIFLLY